MKKIIVAAALFLAAFSANAQEAKKGDFNIGITAGAGLSTMRFDDPYDLYDPEPIANIQGGFVFDYSFIDNLFLEIAGTYQRKGYKKDRTDFEKDDCFEIDNETKTSIHYVAFPVTLNYRINLGKIGLIPQVGPYFAIGVAGNVKTNYKLDLEDANYQKIAEDMLDDLREKAPKNNIFDNENNKRFDFGMRFGLGLAFSSKAKFTVGYDLGLLDLCRTEGVDNKSQHSTFFGAFTYYFK